MVFRKESNEVFKILASNNIKFLIENLDFFGLDTIFPSYREVIWVFVVAADSTSKLRLLREAMNR